MSDNEKDDYPLDWLDKPVRGRKQKPDPENEKERNLVTYKVVIKHTSCGTSETYPNVRQPKDSPEAAATNTYAIFSTTHHCTHPDTKNNRDTYEIVVQ